MAKTIKQESPRVKVREVYDRWPANSLATIGFYKLLVVSSVCAARKSYWPALVQDRAEYIWSRNATPGLNDTEIFHLNDTENPCHDSADAFPTDNKLAALSYILFSLSLSLSHPIFAGHLRWRKITLAGNETPKSKFHVFITTSLEMDVRDAELVVSKWDNNFPYNTHFFGVHSLLILFPKCDEKTPVCSNCGRHYVSCIYSSARSSSYLEGDPESVVCTTSFTAGDLFDIPESKSRRMLERKMSLIYLRAKKAGGSLL